MVGMSNPSPWAAGGPLPYPPPPPGPSYPGYAPAGYPPPQAYGAPPPGYYPPPGYRPPPGYYPPPGYPAYPAVLKPGVIPLRPLSLSDIYNGAVAYIRTNPKATLGLTTIVVVVAQLIALLLQIGPLTAMGGFESDAPGEVPSTGAIALFSGATIVGFLVTQLASVLLTGMLTVVIGRSVFGGSITIGEAWQRLRGRFLALLGLTALQGFVVVMVAVLIVVAVVAADAVGGGLAAFVVGAPLMVAALLGFLYAVTVLLFAPALIVLERLGVFAAIARSFTLVKKDFWRVLGIWLLAAIVASVVATAVGVPFSLVGQLLSLEPERVGMFVGGLILVAIGGMIGQIITAPFGAGVDVLLYTDRRIRAEAFDLVLQTGAAGPAESTDQLWLTRRF
ncbi:membrane protein [Mycolicibacterium wolinskyi]|uniref:Membrane protein n=1 Tax=Mycolicibacterium wolinskyi TaxID=59750 RepID=A0A132PME1_9MYCO|nr:membrane protein [Mycolicibacterium wolinskyi]